MESGHPTSIHARRTLRRLGFAIRASFEDALKPLFGAGAEKFKKQTLSFPFRHGHKKDR
jgi:hypothetical protein